MNASIEAIGNWDAQIGASLHTALQASVEICGRTGEEACRHAMILMARSASAITAKSSKNRAVENDYSTGKNLPFITVLRQHAQPNRLYKFQFAQSYKQSRAGTAPTGDWNTAKRIKGQGIGKRSWMWGLKRLGATGTSRPIPGTSKLFTIKSDTSAGYVKQNLIEYIRRAMQQGWERSVETSAANKIMKQAANNMEQVWRYAVGAPKSVTPSRKTLAQYFTDRLRFAGAE